MEVYLCYNALESSYLPATGVISFDFNACVQKLLLENHKEMGNIPTIVWGYFS